MLRHRVAALAPYAALLALTLIFFARLALTDHILARGDTFAYFYPYWHARDTALRLGQLPLWSPDLFMGVPLLANSQLGTFYPPNWLVVSLSPPDGIRVSILLHMGWALLGAYLLARRTLHLTALPALAAASVFGLSGHVLAHVEQINQLQGLAWLPWLMLLFARALDRPRATLWLGIGLALQFLSGHTQTVFITGVGLALYGLLAELRSGLGSRRWRFVPILAVAALIAVILALPQIVPTLELTDVSNRRGGFTPNQATAFSFSPFAVGRGLLPSYDAPIFGEYTAYPGIAGLALALVGLLAALSPARTPPEASDQTKRRARSPRLVWGGIALAGLLLAFGLYNPLYWWLASLPGFNLFRVPARWLALFALGVAMLAGLGLQALMLAPPRGRILGVTAAATAAVVAVLGGLSLLASRTPEPIPMSDPTLASWIGWGAALVAVVALLIALFIVPRRRPFSGLTIPSAFLIVLLVELFAAAQVLPYNDVTPPDAFHARRFTANQLLAYQENDVPPGRVLGISGLLFDPGDRAALEARYAALGLSDEAIRAAFVAVKMKETLTPNLSLLWGIPSIDGFDGGVLPTAHYTAFTSLLLPPDELRTLDGRLYQFLAREPCRGACIPDARWLNLTNTRYLITDKVYDLWYADIAYDTQFATPVTDSSPLRISDLPGFQATALDIFYRCDTDEAADCLTPAASWTTGDGTTALAPADPEFPDLDGFHLARLAAPSPLTPTALEVTSASPVTIRALTLVDTRTGDFVQLAPDPWRRVLSSDIKLYENTAVMPRAFVVHDLWITADTERGTEAALDLMRDPGFDPARTAVLASGVADPAHDGAPLSGSAATITAYTAERIELSVTAAAAGVLVLTDAHYPGWQATVNGAPVPITRADVMFRGVPVPAGESAVVFEYRPGWLPGILTAGGAAWLVALLGALLLTARRPASDGTI